jgi:hypothetical protein
MLHALKESLLLVIKVVRPISIISTISIVIIHVLLNLLNLGISISYRGTWRSKDMLL